MQPSFNIMGFPGTMQKVTSTDAAQGLASTLVVRADRQPAIAVAITVETNAIRVTWDGTTPTTSTGTATGHVLAAGQSLRLENSAAIGNFRFVSATSGSHGILHITPEYAMHAAGSF
jgi:hypothetical protein